MKYLPQLVFVAAIFAVCAGVGGSLFYNAKGKSDVAVEMAKHGASPAAINCTLNPPAPIQWSAVARCNAALDGLNSSRGN